MLEKQKKQWPITEILSKFVIKLFGWKAVGKVPDAPKYVLVGYPHTSNFDMPLGLFLFTSMGVHLHWLGKESLFKGPLGWLLKKTGGIAINREHSQNFVQNIKTIFDSHEHLVIALSPEGTRKKTDYWRTGFYYMALAANVPIALGFLDYSTKTGGFGPLIWPSGDIEKDLQQIRSFYKNIRGKYPELEGTIAVRPKTQNRKSS